jgi:alkylation response protein AidB-like acyl-CoA dehydrogenase
MGRLKLGANVIGAAKKAITDSVKYSNERKQFGVLISTFGALKHKMAEQVIRLFAAESAVYRVSNDVDTMIHGLLAECGDYGRTAIESISHYAVEAAILKVVGSEMLDFVADEAVQIHGGMGYSAEMMVERGYRDSRINRIFEGTNEINRLLVVDTAMKRAMKGDFDLYAQAEKIAAELNNITDGKTAGESYFQEKTRYIKNFKKVILLCINGVTKKFGKGLVNEQEVLNNIAEMMMETYVSESLALRVEKMSANGTPSVYKDMLDVNINDTANIVRKSALDAIGAFADNDSCASLIKAVENLTRVSCINVKDARRRIADKLIEDNTYKF